MLEKLPNCHYNGYYNIIRHIALKSAIIKGFQNMMQLTIGQPISFIETAKFENMLNYTSENGFFHEEFLLKHKLREEFFTRKRKMDGSGIALFSAISQKRPTSNALEAFWDDAGLEEEGDPMSQQAFSQARLKLGYTAFEELFFLTRESAKGFAPSLEAWHGYRLIAIDGSQINLPPGPYMLSIFGGNGSGASNCAALASVAATS